MDSGLPVKRTIADQVAELVRQRILTGQLKGGQPIRQEHLAAELGVSRIPLREALKQLAAEGFVLSPVVEDAVDAVPLLAGTPPSSARVVAIRLEVDAWGRFEYDRHAEVRLAPLVVAGAPEAAPTPALATAIATRRLYRTMLASRPGVPSEILGIRGDVLFAHAASSVDLPVPAGTRAVALGFGLLDDAASPGRTTGVCFRVVDAHASDDAPPLFARCLHPVDVAEDRGRHRARLAVDGTAARTLRLETRCEGSCAWGWSYWSDVAFEPASAVDGAARVTGTAQPPAERTAVPRARGPTR